MKKLFYLLFFFSTTPLLGQELRDSVLIKNELFEIMYSEVLEQPLYVFYIVRDFEKGADRKGMDFWVPKDVHTSNNDDYKYNEWDKGHMAPAAHFSDNEDNLKSTFSYANSALQHKDLNRKEWRYLEAQERKWAEEFGTLKVKVNVLFDENSKVLSTGATVPSGFFKYIYFESTKEEKCYYFPNNKPEKNWTEYLTSCI